MNIPFRHPECRFKNRSVLKFIVGRAAQESIGINSLVTSGPSLDEAFVQSMECG